MNMNKGGVVPRRAPLNLRCSPSGEDPRPRLLTVVVREASSQRARPLLGHPLRTRDGIQKYSFSLNEKKKKIVFFSRHLEKDLEKRKCIIHCRIEGWVTEGNNKVEICINSFWIFY